MEFTFKPSGLLVVNKPKGWTSFDVVKKAKGLLRPTLPEGRRGKPPKVGHTGTLDPAATGVLVLCVGRATKLVSKIMGAEKEYLADITFGATSTTDDQEGEITENPDAQPAALGVIEALLQEQFTGTIAQLPPIYSAKKVDGKRAYALARAGKEVKLEPNEVVVHKLEILDYKWPVLKLRIQCGKGFYVRSLARDLGEKLEVGGYLSELQRTRVGAYPIERALDIEQITLDKLIPA